MGIRDHEEKDHVYKYMCVSRALLLNTHANISIYIHAYIHTDIQTYIHEYLGIMRRKWKGGRELSSYILLTSVRGHFTEASLGEDTAAALEEHEP